MTMAQRLFILYMNTAIKLKIKYTRLNRAKRKAFLLNGLKN